LKTGFALRQAVTADEKRIGHAAVLDLGEHEHR